VNEGVVKKCRVLGAGIVGCTKVDYVVVGNI